MTRKNGKTGTHSPEDAATEFLRVQGFRWDGQPANVRVDVRQIVFERRIITTPMGRANRGYRSK